MVENYFNTCAKGFRFFTMAIMSCVVSHRGYVLRLVASFPMQICSNDTSLPGGSSSQCLVKVHPAVIKYSVDARDKKYIIISPDPRWPTGCGHVMGGFECGDNQERAFHPEYMGTHNTWPKLPSQITSWIMRLDTKPGQRTHYPDIRRQLVPSSASPAQQRLDTPHTLITALRIHFNPDYLS